MHYAILLVDLSWLTMVDLISHPLIWKLHTLILVRICWPIAQIVPWITIQLFQDFLNDIFRPQYPLHLLSINRLQLLAAFQHLLIHSRILLLKVSFKHLNLVPRSRLELHCTFRWLSGCNYKLGLWSLRAHHAGLWDLSLFWRWSSRLWLVQQWFHAVVDWNGLFKYVDILVFIVFMVVTRRLKSRDPLWHRSSRSIGGTFIHAMQILSSRAPHVWVIVRVK